MTVDTFYKLFKILNHFECYSYSQVDTFLSPIEVDYPYTLRRSLLNLQERRTRSAEINDSNGQKRPMSAFSGVTTHLYDNKNVYGISRMSSPIPSSESYDWTKHECNVQEEIASSWEDIDEENEEKKAEMVNKNQKLYQH